MAIHYTLTSCKNLVGNNGGKKIYARAQSVRTVSKTELARYAAEHYGVNLDNHCVESVIDMLKRSLVDMLKAGNRVSLDELGTFYCHIDSVSKTEEEYAEEGFKPSRDIKAVTVKWQPSEDLKSLKDSDFVEFKQKPTKRAVKSKLKESMTKPDE